MTNYMQRRFLCGGIPATLLSLIISALTAHWYGALPQVWPVLLMQLGVVFPVVGTLNMLVHKSRKPNYKTCLLSAFYAIAIAVACGFLAGTLTVSLLAFAGVALYVAILGSAIFFFEKTFGWDR